MDDNTISANAECINELTNILELESQAMIEWFKNNKMTVNPDKFQAIIIEKKKKNHKND